MSCVQFLRGIALECNSSLGGIKEVYITPYDNVKKVTIGINYNPYEQITNITLDENKGFIGYKFKPNTANMTSTLNVDDTHNVTVTTDLVLSFLRQDAEKREEISLLTSAETAVIVKDANNKYWYLGKDLPVMASAGTAETGTNFTDSNRYSITLQDNSVYWPYEIKVAPVKTGDKNYVNIDTILIEPSWGNDTDGWEDIPID